MATISSGKHVHPVEKVHEMSVALQWFESHVIQVLPRMETSVHFTISNDLHMSPAAELTSQRLRQLSLFDGQNTSSFYVLLCAVCAIAVVLFVYGVYKSKRATEMDRQCRESTADTIVDLEIETPKDFD
ncbi:hypothetical protein AeMF1_015273 [Aphanomyces euteiches]|nr:hypothetical protein AeMF1_015273 [Aphanomyces euteiches]KAH9183122.1 hypothetical protein AeNC1_014901 [Aphanomyces euteiches]